MLMGVFNPTLEGKVKSLLALGMQLPLRLKNEGDEQ